MKLIKYPKVLLFAVILFLATSKSSYGQFQLRDNDIFLRLQNDSGQAIRGATVYLNGVKMTYIDTCPYYPDRSCYYCPGMELDRRVYLTVQHPDFLPFADSVNGWATVHLFTTSDTDYYYDYMKVPYKKTPDAYVCNMRLRDSIAPVRRRIEAAGGRTVSEFSQCGYSFGGDYYGPYSLLYVLPRTDSTEALHRYLGRTFDSGPWVKQPHHSVAVASYFKIYTRIAQLPEAKKLLEQMKKDSVLNYQQIYPSALTEITIYLDRADAYRVQPLIEQLLKTKLFCDPVMNFDIYACVD